jgi:SAM-dependent methyltransferase
MARQRPCGFPSLMAPSPSSSPPPCPVTGAPARRHVQTVPVALLRSLWRITFGGDVDASFAGAQRLELWESPTGLHYFDPPLVGDNGFYASFYATLARRGLYRARFMREEFVVAARDVPARARVLDVGCGYGPFRDAVPHADYLGIDPHFDGAAAWVRRESLIDHLQTHAGAYDVVCAFQVMEHVADPAGFFADLVRAARPGGRVIVGVPQVPCAHTRIPNFLLNAPPHHLTWWTKAALAALAQKHALAVERLEGVAWNEVDSVIWWTARCTPVKIGSVYFRHSWSWHASAAIGYACGSLMNKIFGPPRALTDEGGALILTARVPHARDGHEIAP